jgi:hypothetical protein
MHIKTAAGPRPFWEGLDPDKPEPLDKILAALHCYQVRPPAGGKLGFTFTVDINDHNRIRRGFPELRKLAAAIRTEIPFVGCSLAPLTTPPPCAMPRLYLTRPYTLGV